MAINENYYNANINTHIKIRHVKNIIDPIISNIAKIHLLI
jgi:hypothetical protein